jgi:hypothetical protein
MNNWWSSYKQEDLQGQERVPNELECITISQYKVNGTACISNIFLGLWFKIIPAQYEERDRLRYYP